MNIWFRLAAFFMVTGVGLGAFGAHGLKSRLTADALQIYQTAVFYHLIHALGLFVVAWASAGGPVSPTGPTGGTAGTFKTAPAIRFAGWTISMGIVIFAGSLYLLAVTGVRWFGAVTPIGGACFLAGWTALAVGKARG